jgi:hypothetical protein
VGTVASADGGGISGIGIAAVFAGGILVWSGVRGQAVSGVFRDLISGKSPSTLKQTTPVSASGLFGGLLGGLGSALSPTNLLSAVPSTTGGVSGTNAQNKALGQKMAAAYGWGSGAEWAALNWIVMEESGWSDTIVNPGGTASGIAQNINGFGPGYQSGNAPQQIAWLLQYIKNRYGDPIAAMKFHQANGYY